LAAAGPFRTNDMRNTPPHPLTARAGVWRAMAAIFPKRQGAFEAKYAAGC